MPLKLLAMNGRKEMFYLTTHSTHFIDGYKSTQIAREDTRCRHIGYSFRLAARVLLYHHPTDNGAMGHRIDPSWGGPIELFLVPASVPRLE